MDKKVKQFAIIQVLLVMIFSLFACNLANRQSVLQTSSFVTTKSTSVTVTPKITATPCPSIALPSATTAETDVHDTTPDEPTVTVHLTSYSPPPAPGQKSLAPFDSALTPLQIDTAATEDNDFIYYNRDNVIHRFNKATKDDVPIRASTGTIQEMFMFHDDLFYVVQDYAYTSDGAPIEDNQGRYKTTNTLYRYKDRNTDEVVLKDVNGIYRIDSQYIYYDTGSYLCIFDLIHNKKNYARSNNFEQDEYVYSWCSRDRYDTMVCASQKFKIINYINGKRVKSYSLSDNFIGSDDGLNIVDYEVDKNGTVFKILNVHNKTSKHFTVPRKIINIQHAYIKDNTLYIISVDNDNYTSAFYGIDLNGKKIVYSNHINGWISATIAQNGVWYYCKEVADDNGVEEYVCRFNVNNLSHTIMSRLDEFGDSINFIELCGGYIFGFEENWIDLENYRFEFMLPIN